MFVGSPVPILIGLRIKRFTGYALTQPLNVPCRPLGCLRDMSRTMCFYHLEICRSLSPPLRPCRNFIFTSTPFISIRGRNRCLHSLHRSIRNLPPRRNWNGTQALGVCSAVFLAGAGIFYNIFTSRPLKLESDDSEFLGGKEIAERYLPPIPPYTIEQANEALRWVRKISE